MTLTLHATPCNRPCCLKGSTRVLYVKSYGTMPPLGLYKESAHRKLRLLCEKPERFRSTENRGCLLFCNFLALSVASLQRSPGLFGWQASSLGFGPPLLFCVTIVLTFASWYGYFHFSCVSQVFPTFLIVLLCCAAYRMEQAPESGRECQRLPDSRAYWKVLVGWY